MPNAAHILLPSPAGTHYWQEQDERYPAKVWQRPWLQKQPKLPGRVLRVNNEPVQSRRGLEHWTSFQVALFMLEKARKGNFDWIEVVTPGLAGTRGGQAIATKEYSVKELTARGFGSLPAPTIARNTVRVQPEGEEKPLAGEWKVNDNTGTLAKVG